MRRFLGKIYLGAPLVLLNNYVRSVYYSYDDKNCVQYLWQKRIKIKPVGRKNFRDGCFISDLVVIKGGFGTPLFASCRLAKALVRFERQVLQPLAWDYFGVAIKEIEQAGAYNCRPVRGRKFLMSEHAFANAIDITGFKFKDGYEIKIKENWDTPGRAAKFLRDVSKHACLYFTSVVTPDDNSAHSDHFHFSVGLFGNCTGN